MMNFHFELFFFFKHKPIFNVVPFLLVTVFLSEHIMVVLPPLLILVTVFKIHAATLHTLGVAFLLSSDFAIFCIKSDLLFLFTSLSTCFFDVGLHWHRLGLHWHRLAISNAQRKLVEGLHK